MKKILAPALATIVALCSCSKENLKPGTVLKNETDNAISLAAARSADAAKGINFPYKLYTIGTGRHACDQNDLRYVSLSQMKFAVIFDSSAVYTTKDPANQNDINMLYGFSEGPNHLLNSARIGWSYNSAGGGSPSLKLYAYAYIHGVRAFKYITEAPILVSPNVAIKCNIILSGHTYIFRAGGVEVTLPRESDTYDTEGYLLYPYFGGTETAPHKVRIRIKNL